MRSWRPLGGWKAAAWLVALLAVVSMAPAIFAGRVPSQTDWLRNFGPWGRQPWLADTPRPFNPGGGDSFFMYIPDRRVALDEWRAGRLPLWNPYISGGVPLLGLQTCNPLDPLILFELLVPGGHGMGLAWALLIGAAGCGLVLFLRDQGISDPGALAVGGVAFALNPFFLSWLEDRVFLAGLATAPLALWALERVARRGAGAVRESAVLALAVGYAALAGTLQTFALYLLLLLVRWVWLQAEASRGHSAAARRGSTLLAVGFTAGLAIGALPLISGVEALSHATRLGARGNYVETNFLHWRALALLFTPDAFNLPHQGELATLGEFKRRFMSGSGFGFAGVTTLGLALLALLRRSGPARERLFWGGLAAATVTFLLLLATPLHVLLNRLLPWIDDIDLLRGLFVVNLSLSVLAAWGAALLGACPSNPDFGNGQRGSDVVFSRHEQVLSSLGCGPGVAVSAFGP